MDGSDISLAIRRARRSGAKRIDLSCRGIKVWPDDLFSLRQLEALDVSGNELSTVDPSITKLESLVELNLANNRIENMADIDVAIAGMQQLHSLALDGNPAASCLAPAALRQLRQPSVPAGQVPVQVIRGIIQQGMGEPASSSSPAENDVVSFFADGGDGIPPVDLAPPASDFLSPPDDPEAWRKGKMLLIAEVETLRAQVNELENGQKQASAGASGHGGSSHSSAPSWLQQDSKSSLAATLPSRRAGLMHDEEVADLKNQLLEEQRRAKRLEKDIQRLSDRAQERDLASGSAGSAPHFDWNSDVEMGDIINQGGFSVVHKGFWHGTKVAIKKLFDPNISQELLAEFDNEVQKLEQIRHPNILMLLAVHRKPPALSIITELVEGGSMFQLLHFSHQFNAANGMIVTGDLPQALNILLTAGSAIAFLHARGIAHRDIKSQNVLLSPALDVKLCDFGLARMKSELMTGAMQFAGTPNYMAPEIFRNARYTENVDVFAFGTLLWEAAARDIPWANMDPADIRQRVVAGRMLEIPRDCPHTLQQLIREAWTADRNLRPPMAEVLSALRAYLQGVSSSGPTGRPRRPLSAAGTRAGEGSTMATSSALGGGPAIGSSRR